MGVVITGDVLGERQRSGNFDDGKAWSVRELLILDGMDTMSVRLESFTGTVPQRGERVAIDCEFRSGKFRGRARVPEIEAALAPAPAGK